MFGSRRTTPRHADGRLSVARLVSVTTDVIGASRNLCPPAAAWRRPSASSNALDSARTDGSMVSPVGENRYARYRPDVPEHIHQAKSSRDHRRIRVIRHNARTTWFANDRTGTAALVVVTFRRSHEGGRPRQRRLTSRRLPQSGKGRARPASPPKLAKILTKARNLRRFSDQPVAGNRPDWWAKITGIPTTYHQAAGCHSCR